MAPRFHYRTRQVVDKPCKKGKGTARRVHNAHIRFMFAIAPHSCGSSPVSELSYTALKGELCSSHKPAGVDVLGGPPHNRIKRASQVTEV